MMGSLKHNLFAAPLDACCDAMLAGSKGEASYCDYRMDGRLYVSPKDDRVTVTHAIPLRRRHGQAARLRLSPKSLSTRRRSPTRQRRYVFSSKRHRLRWKELVDAKSLELPPKHVETYYLQFAIMKQHVAEDKRAKCLELVLGVRTYLNYHIKCTKAFLHTRMQDKVTELHKVLKAAYPQNVKGRGRRRRRRRKTTSPSRGHAMATPSVATF